MMMRPKSPTNEETTRNIQRQIPYGPDERARLVEHVCAILLDSRFGPGASDDMFYIEPYDGVSAPPSFIELFDMFASRPVAVRNGDEIIELTPGQAMHLILTDPDCGYTIFEVHSKPPITTAPPNGPPL